MNSGVPHERLGEVSVMAVTLADRILMEGLTKGTLPVAHGAILWVASLLLEENGHPVPVIVTEVLARFRHSELADDAEPDGETPSAEYTAGPTSLPIRFPRPLQTGAIGLHSDAERFCQTL